MDIRTGIGIDFHRLIFQPKSPLVLGGVEIQSDFALVGHSDADVVLHALSDAILGALGEGDIGEFFSNTDPINKGLDSKNICELARTKLLEADFSISNVDITIIGEKPHVSPHKTNIRLSLSKILAILEERISVKATTTEQMGALGREEGLACLANVLLIKK